MSRKAFLLFDVTLTIAILSIGLVFIICSINMSMKVARTSFNYSQAINLAYQKAFELEREWHNDGLEVSNDEGAFVDNKRFSWKYAVEKLPDKNLGKLTLAISWQEGKREEEFNILTYIKTK